MNSNNRINNNSNNSINDNTNTNNCNSLSTNTGNGTNRSAQSRKDRSCKGKRYLEILNENKFAKRSRTISQTAGQSVGDKEETSAKNISSNQSGSNSGTNTAGHSKWVSGGFDLEEHIAQLPQLGDTHLLNALSHSKANKTSVNSTNKSCLNDSFLNSNNHLKPQKSVNNCSVNESNHSSGSDRSNSDIEDNDFNGVKSLASNRINDNTLKLNDKTDAKLLESQEFIVDINTNINNNNNKQTFCEPEVEKSDPIGEESITKKDDSVLVNITNNTSDLVNNSLPSTQGIEFSDGLAALAEVALQQPRNTV